MFDDDNRRFLITVPGKEARQLFQAQAEAQAKKAQRYRALAHKLTPQQLLGEQLDADLMEEVKQTYGSSALNNVKSARDALTEKAQQREIRAKLLAFVADHLGDENQFVSARELEHWNLFES